jgi:cysteine-rich repeat protein
MRLLVGPGLAAGLTALAVAAGGATLTVNSAGDDTTPGNGLVTLREAIVAAEGDTATDLGETGSGADVIVFAPALVAGGDAAITIGTVSDTEVGPSAFRIASDVTLSGPSGDDGLSLVRDAGVANLRFFHVVPGGALTLESLTLANGRAVGGDGGGTFGFGDFAVAGGGGGAGLGGAVYVRGSLAIRGCTLSGNAAQGGAGGFGFAAEVGSGGSGGGGLGGAGGSADSTGAAENGGGGGGTFGAGASAAAGGGGGGSSGAAMGATGGAGGGGNAGAPGSAGGGGGGGASGASGATGGFGGGGGGAGKGVNAPAVQGGDGGFGGGGGGGGDLEMMAATFGAGDGGFGGGAGGGFQGTAGYGGESPEAETGVGGAGAGLGGAVFNHGGSVEIENATFWGNTAQGGGFNWPGIGGALFNLNGTVTIASATFAGNDAFQGGDIAQVSYEMAPGIARAPAHLTLEGVVLASGTPDNVRNERNFDAGFADTATLTASAPNLMRNPVVNFGGTVDVSGVTVADPQMSALADNGGPTQTSAPVYPGSPAVDAGGAAGPAADQRGETRPSGPSFDLGAVEVAQFCGNGVTESPEECDDGNTAALDGCLACQLRCATTPASGCTLAGTASLAIDERKAGKEKVALALKKLGELVTLDDLGDPVSGTTRYAVCVYGPEVAFDVRLERGGATCGTQPCWKNLGITGYAYKDALASAEGVTALKEKGGTPGKGSIAFAAANDAKQGESALATGAAAALAGATSATVQVLASDGSCYEAALGTVRKADGTQFKAKTP